ncbi:hypothetical protein POVWA2_051100 [Plasmodium ovale wallikeri]|uniref:Uncharacterized protein n=1 Tax=Plasmodium ovale wallikeri TaxID=864142 RepID=A0A1A8ZEG8_PLAOA|nr:hypothetical protein POVWA1_045840 [Plasmodium ovale wallikeri]SBT45986.1 hypothetical protein POVWA2_051100 [Plasmodium ovale wallikeri]
MFDSPRFFRCLPSGKDSLECGCGRAVHGRSGHSWTKQSNHICPNTPKHEMRQSKKHVSLDNFWHIRSKRGKHVRRTFFPLPAHFPLSKRCAHEHTSTHFLENLSILRQMRMHTICAYAREQVGMPRLLPSMKGFRIYAPHKKGDMPFPLGKFGLYEFAAAVSSDCHTTRENVVQNCGYMQRGSDVGENYHIMWS